MQLCPQCGHLNDERAKFCSECGSKLSAVVPIVPVSDQTPIERLEEPISASPTQSESQDRELLDQIDFVLEESEVEPMTREANVTVREPSPEDKPPQPSLAAPVAASRSTPTSSTEARTRLQVIRGERLNIEYPIYPGKNYIGRTDDKPVDIDLEDQERADRIWSSRQHAILHYENGVLMLEDLNSLNGTFVNRVRLIPGQLRTLQANDVIQIGTVQLKVIFSDV